MIGPSACAADAGSGTGGRCVTGGDSASDLPIKTSLSIVSRKRSSWTYMCKIGIILQCYLKYDAIIGHFDIGIIFSYIGISQQPLYMLLSHEIHVPQSTQSLIGCSTLSQEYCKLIG